jgi:hypothetical protein
MREEVQREVRSRFFLNNGQFFAYNSRKNLWWYLNGERFGFGDLREKDILLIRLLIEPGEVFEGFNEHHLTEWMQRESPMIRITAGGGVEFPAHVPVSQETRDKVKRS